MTTVAIATSITCASIDLIRVSIIIAVCPHGHVMTSVGRVTHCLVRAVEITRVRDVLSTETRCPTKFHGRLPGRGRSLG